MRIVCPGEVLLDGIDVRCVTCVFKPPVVVLES